MDKGIVKDLTINFVGLVLPTFVSLATVPAYIHILGVERFGAIALVWVLIDYFAVLGLGMSVAAQNRISKAYSSGDAYSCIAVFWSAVWLNVVGGVVIGLVVYLGGLIYTAFFYSAASSLKDEIAMALPWLAVAVPVANATCVFAAAICGAERFAAYNTTQTTGMILFQLVPLCIAWLIGPTLQGVVACAVIVRFLTAAQLGRLSVRVLGVSDIRLPQWDVVKGLFSFGGWVFISTVTTIVTESLDRVLLGAVLGARPLTYYSVPKNLVTRLNIVPLALIRALFPRLSVVNREHAQALTQQSLEFLNGAFTPIAIFAMLAVGPFLQQWVGNEIASVSAPIAQILIVAVWLLGQAETTRVLIQSQLNPATAALASFLQLPAYMVMLWFAIKRFGLPGVAVANIVRTMFDYVILLWLSHIPARPIVLDMLAHLAFLLVGLWLANSMLTPSVTLAAGIFLVAVNVVWSLAMSPGLRGLGRSLLLRLQGGDVPE
jgi:O-antigen/teichoic acid export membrane protein